jgi:hypothetical protein
MDCKTQLLRRVNSQFQCDTEGFFFENEKYPFSQMTELIGEIKKISGYRFKLGFVFDESNDSESDKESQESKETSEKEGSETDGASDSDRSSNKGKYSSHPCIACKRIYTNPIV